MLRVFLSAGMFLMATNLLAFAQPGLHSVATRLEVQINVVGIATGTGSTSMGVGLVWLLDDGTAWPVDDQPFELHRIRTEMARKPQDVLAWRQSGRQIQLKKANKPDWDEAITEIPPFRSAMPHGAYFKAPWTPDNLNGFRGRAYQFLPNGRFELAEVPPGRHNNTYDASAGSYRIDGYTLRLTHDTGKAEAVSLIVNTSETAADGRPRFAWISGDLYERF